jgi:cytochrome c oxidase cbb3-type subunit 3
MSSRFLELAVVALIALALLGCERESRRFSDSPATPRGVQTIRQSELQPGSSIPTSGTPSPYDDNAYAVSQGKQLFEWFNCKGCHADGGGSIGPALMDEKWIYGSAPANIYATIVEGRPNGMPSFRDKIPPQQVWQLVAYVRSLSGQLRKDVEPSRADHLFTRKSESSSPKSAPVSSSAPRDTQ